MWIACISRFYIGWRVWKLMCKTCATTVDIEHVRFCRTTANEMPPENRGHGRLDCQDDFVLLERKVLILYLIRMIGTKPR